MPLDVLHADFTELPFADGTQKEYLMPIIDHVGKFAFDWTVGKSANQALALHALRQAREMMQQISIKPAGMVMHHD